MGWPLGGFVDCLMTAAVAREVFQQLGKKVLIGKRRPEGGEPVWSEVWESNPYFRREMRPFLSWRGVEELRATQFYEDVFGHRPYINYSSSPSDSATFLAGGHAIEFGCQKFGIRPRELRPEIFLSPKEIAEGERMLGGRRNFIHIEPNFAGEFSANNKDWGFEKWQEVVNFLSSRFSFVQTTKSPNDRILDRVTAIPTETFRLAASVMIQAQLFVGTEGGFHHLARALSVPAVVVYGGYCSPELTGYSDQTNLFVEEGSPCGRKIPCLHCRRCMDEIVPEQVISSVVALASARLNPQFLAGIDARAL